MSSNLIEYPINKVLSHICSLTKAASWKHTHIYHVGKINIYIYIYIYIYINIYIYLHQFSLRIIFKFLVQICLEFDSLLLTGYQFDRHFLLYSKNSFNDLYMRLVHKCSQCQCICLFVWVLWHINLWRLFNAKSIFIRINSSISNNSV